MDIKTFLTETRQTQEDFARKCGCTPGVISHLCTGRMKKVSARLAVEIEKASGGRLRANQFSPDVDFDYLRGTEAWDGEERRDIKRRRKSLGRRNNDSTKG